MTRRRRIVYLGIGSNVDAESHIREGLGALTGAFGRLQVSPAYRTRAVGFEGGDFINLVVSVETDRQPLEIKTWLNDLEDRHGRARDVPKFSDRTLDIDILLYDDLWLRIPGLELPRPEIETFAHVLRPLADLAPDLVHPTRLVTMARLWRDFEAKPDMQTITLQN